MIPRFQSHRKHKKWAVLLPDGCTVHYGDCRYEDYTIHRNVERLERFLNRYASKHVNDPHYPGFWSRWHLWNETVSPEHAWDDAVRRAEEYFGKYNLTHHEVKPYTQNAEFLFSDTEAA